jgi:hypothetical protein
LNAVPAAQPTIMVAAASRQPSLLSNTGCTVRNAKVLS